MVILKRTATGRISSEEALPHGLNSRQRNPVDMSSSDRISYSFALCRGWLHSSLKASLEQLGKNRSPLFSILCKARAKLHLTCSHWFRHRYGCAPALFTDVCIPTSLFSAFADFHCYRINLLPVLFTLRSQLLFFLPWILSRQFTRQNPMAPFNYYRFIPTSEQTRLCFDWCIYVDSATAFRYQFIWVIFLHSISR